MPKARFLLMLMMLTMAMSMTGCRAGTGIVGQLLSGPPEIEALYEPADRPTAIFVDDPKTLLPGIDLPGLIAGRIGDALTKQDVITQVIPPNMIDRLRSKEDDFASWPIDRVGREVGAQQVLYVQVIDFKVTEDDAVFRPSAAVRVKWVDVGTGNRMWPESGGGSAGHPLVTQQRYTDMSGATAMTVSIVGRNLAEALAADIAKLFYDHRVPEPGSRLPG